MEKKINESQISIKDLEKANELEKKQNDEIKDGNRKSSELLQKNIEEIRGLTKKEGDLTLNLESITEERDELKARLNQLESQAKCDSIEMKRLKEEVAKKETVCENLEEEIIKYRTLEGSKYHRCNLCRDCYEHVNYILI